MCSAFSSARSGGDSDFGCDFQSGFAGHTNIEKYNIRLHQLKCRNRIHAISGFGNNGAFRPRTVERGTQAIKHQRFIVSD